jgi:hypothetical protein
MRLHPARVKRAGERRAKMVSGNEVALAHAALSHLRCMSVTHCVAMRRPNARPHAEMPEISRFIGIVITMYCNDHRPPHFHVRYERYRAKVGIADGNVIEGALPTRVLALVAEWAHIHRVELDRNWTSLATEGTFARIAPLE